MLSLICTAAFSVPGWSLQVGPSENPAPSAGLRPGAGSEVRIELPPGPCAGLLDAELDPAAPAVVLPLSVPPEWTASAWSTSAPWEAWTRAIGDSSSPASRLHLTRVARRLDRHAEAWAHFAQLPANWAHAALPELLLGLPALVDGIPTLRPILPPKPVFDATTWRDLPPKRTYVASGLGLFGTRVGLAVEVAPEGVEVKLTWEAGPPLELMVQIPTPAQRKARLVYVDWDRVDLEPLGYRVRLAPATLDQPAEMILWARCEADQRPWPHSLGTHETLRAPLLLVTTADDPELERVRQLAHFLTANLDLEVRVHVTDSPTPPPREASKGLTPIRIQLSPGPHRDAKLRDLAAQAEHAALARMLVESRDRR